MFYCFQNETKYIICAIRSNRNNKANPKGHPTSRVTYFPGKHTCTVADRVYNNINNKTSFTYTEKEHFSYTKTKRDTLTS